MEKNLEPLMKAKSTSGSQLIYFFLHQPNYRSTLLDGYDTFNKQDKSSKTWKSTFLDKPPSN